MKVKSYKMVILPYGSVPHRAIFRYNHNWWRRYIGSIHLAEKILVETNLIYCDRCLIEDEALVALPRYRLERPVAFASVVDEFDVCPK